MSTLNVNEALQMLCEMGYPQIDLFTRDDRICSCCLEMKTIVERRECFGTELALCKDCK